MRKWIFTLALTLAFSMAALAQSSESSTSSGASQTTPSTSQSQTETKTKSHHHAGMGKEATLTGCLSGPNDEGAYLLKNGRHKNGIEVGSAEGVDLKAHVGHEVKLTGTWESSGAAIGEKETKAEKGEAHERHFKVTNVQHISDTCTATAGEATGKTKSKSKGSGTEAPK